MADVVTLLDEIRAIARSGLHYAENPFDRARCERLLEIAAQGYADVTGLESDVVRARFLAETGYATAKVGADGAVFDDDGRDSCVSVVYVCSIESHDFRFQAHEVLEAAWHHLDEVTDWHLNHEQLARLAFDGWSRGTDLLHR